MGDFVSLRKAAEEAALTLLNMGDDEIFVISHLDADGISAAGIICSLLKELDKPFVLEISPQLREDRIREFVEKNEPKEVIIADMGSGYISTLIKLLNNCEKLLIIDHHQVEKTELIAPFKLVLFNPRLYGFSGDSEISASGACYLVAHMFHTQIPEIIKLSKLAIVGALGDMQDKGEFRSLIGLNKIIADEAKRAGILDMRMDLIIKSAHFMPSYAALAQSIELMLPEITGNPHNARNLLISLGIANEKNVDKLMLQDLTDEQKRILVDKLADMLISQGEDPSEAMNRVFGMVYMFKDENRVLTKYGRLFASLLNACGRTGNEDLGVAVALGNRGSVYKAAEKIWKEYYETLRRLYFRALKEKIIRGNIIIVDGRNWLDEKLVSPIASYLSGAFVGKKVVVVISRSKEGLLKVSFRKTRESDIDLGKLANKVSTKLGGSGGGHASAAGAFIPEDKFQEFIGELEKCVQTMLK